jgi:type II secretory pathway pseudopilin PulG
MNYILKIAFSFLNGLKGVWIMKVLKNQKGAALITVLVVFVVVMILASSTMMIFNSNLKQVKAQEHNLQAYYLALSGIELGNTALMTDIRYVDGVGIKLYEDFKWDKVKFPNIENDLEDKKSSFGFPLIDTVEIDGNDVEIIITPINTPTDDGYEREIKIESNAIHDSTDTTYSLTLIIDAENIYNRRWE